MRRFITLVSLGLGLAYVVTLIGFVLLRGVPSDPPWWLDLANTFTPYLFIPTLPLFLLGLLLLSRSILLICLLPIATFAILFGGLFLPENPNATAMGSAAANTTFTIMTHNVGMTNRDSQRVVKVIEETDPDVVAFQELTNEMAEALTSHLSDDYEFQALMPRSDHSGVGILSRFPIETQESFSLGRLAQEVVLDVDGQRVHLFNAHTFPPEIRLTGRRPFPHYVIRGFDTESQTEELTTLMERVGEVNGPVVVAGDFNITDQSRQYSLIARSLTDVYREAGWGFGHTFPARGSFRPFPVIPLIRIDYVFHSSELEGLDAWTGNITGSDHLPVVARLALKSTNNR